jgi:hypothetical protein
MHAQTLAKDNASVKAQRDKLFLAFIFVPLALTVVRTKLINLGCNSVEEVKFQVKVRRGHFTFCLHIAEIKPACQQHQKVVCPDVRPLL